MLANSLPEEFSKGLTRQGADLVGFAALPGVAPEGLRNYPYAVSIGVKLLDSVVDSGTSGPTMTYYHHYRTVNALLDQLALSAARRLEGVGARALPIPASQTIDAKSHVALFSHKAAARLAGLGWIGRSALLVTPQFGPRVRFTTVLTDARLTAEAPVLGDGCLDCRRCVSLCPAGAITGSPWEPGAERSLLLDAHRCSEHMRANYMSIGRGAVCGICVSCCPYGKG